VPALAALGVTAQAAFGPLRRRLPMLTAALLVAIGLLTVAGKFRPMPPMTSHTMPGMSMPVAPAGAHEHP